MARDGVRDPLGFDEGVNVADQLDNRVGPGQTSP